jgi:hypothetical protein
METSASPDRSELDGQGARLRLDAVIEASPVAPLGNTSGCEEALPVAAPAANPQETMVLQGKAGTREEALRIVDDKIGALRHDGQSPPASEDELPCMTVLRELQHLASEVERLSAIVGSVNEMMISLFGDEGFLERYRNDSPHLKKFLVRQLVSMFFREKAYRCFLQASTTMVYLGHELRQKGAICADSLLYTNSAVFPLTVLRKTTDYKVYAFCGPDYDPVCGGWLFAEDDATTAEELRRLFQRTSNPLTTAFVAPRWMSSDGMMYFERKEAAHLVRVLAKEATELVITLVANRLVQGTPNVGTEVFPVSLAAPESRKKDGKVWLLVAGKPETQEIRHWGEAFASFSFDVYWYNPSDSNWLRYPGQPRIG